MSPHTPHHIPGIFEKSVLFQRLQEVVTICVNIFKEETLTEKIFNSYKL